MEANSVTSGNMIRRRVVVTGMGMVSPLGTGVGKSWEALCDGKSGITSITRFDASSLKCQVAGEVKDFHPEDFMDKKVIRRFDPFIQYALAAAIMAVDDSGLKVDISNQDRVGVVIGTASGANTFAEVAHNLVMQGRYDEISPFFCVNASGNLVAGVVAIQFGAKGPNHCLMEACAAGTNAIGLGTRFIQQGEADVIIAGGTEAGINLATFASLDALGAHTSKRNKQPEKASRPFDGDRDGFISSEGSGIVILEALDVALRRRAKIYGEVVGYGNNCDAYHYIAPSPGGEEQAKCMKLALSDAVIKPEDMDYINAHGTSTILNDIAETKAIKKVFGEHASKLAISSNKSMIGHMWGAAGAVEAIFTLFTISQEIIPPTINYEIPDPECDLDYVFNEARKAKIKVALSNSFGFGGINATLILKKFSRA